MARSGLFFTSQIFVKREPPMAIRKKRLSVESLESRRMMASVSMPSVMLPVPSADIFKSAIPPEISTPIQVHSVDGMRSAEVHIQFDPQKVSTDVSRIRGGELWDGRVSVLANVDQDAGTIVAFLYSARPIRSGDGELLDIQFVSQDNRPSGEPIEIDLQKVRINEGQIKLTSEPQVGQDASDGVIETGVIDTGIINRGFVKNKTIDTEISDDPNCHPVVIDERSVTRMGQRLHRQTQRVVYGPLPRQAVDEVFAEPVSLTRRFPIANLHRLRLLWSQS